MAAQQVNEDGTELGKVFHRYVGQKRRATESTPPPLSNESFFPTTDTEKAEVLSEFFTSVFTSSQDSHIPELHIPEPEPLCGNWGNKIHLTVRSEQVRDRLLRLNVYTSPQGQMTCILES